LLLEQEAKCEREARQNKIDEFKAQPFNEQMVINEIKLEEITNPNDLNVKISE
jgi:hypothetical protein